jgi:DNA-binding SARP family transcriptional activator
MRVALLGRLEVHDDDDEQVVIAGGKQQELLAVLALHTGRVVPTEHLVDALWAKTRRRECAMGCRYWRRSSAARWVHQISW